MVRRAQERAGTHFGDEAPERARVGLPAVLHDAARVPGHFCVWRAGASLAKAHPPGADSRRGLGERDNVRGAGRQAQGTNRRARFAPWRTLARARRGPRSRCEKIPRLAPSRFSGCVPTNAFSEWHVIRSQPPLGHWRGRSGRLFRALSCRSLRRYHWLCGSRNPDSCLLDFARVLLER